MTDIKVITKTDAALRMTNGIVSKTSLHNVTYEELVQTFGEPVINKKSSDKKVNIEWVFIYKGNPYSIFDYESTSLQTNRRWVVGGGSDYQTFLVDVRNELQEKTDKEFTHGIY